MFHKRNSNATADAMAEAAVGVGVSVWSVVVVTAVWPRHINAKLRRASSGKREAFQPASSKNLSTFVKSFFKTIPSFVLGAHLMLLLLLAIGASACVCAIIICSMVRGNELAVCMQANRFALFCTNYWRSQFLIMFNRKKKKWIKTKTSSI